MDFEVVGDINEDQTISRQMNMIRDEHGERFFLCVNNAGYPASLEARKVYRGVSDPLAEGRGFVRVIDESGEDYLYPATCFVAVDRLPRSCH